MKRDDKLTKLLTLGLNVGILMTWTGVPMVITVGLIIYMLTALMISFYGLKTKGHTILNRLTIVIAGIFSFVAHISFLMHWPFAGAVRMSMVIPLTLYLISLFYGMIKRKEMGYLTILNLAFFMRLIR
ncbi:hypothetical protein GC194_03270 [bacterium]|nr:hypothetical protein [bacterium]